MALIAVLKDQLDPFTNLNCSIEAEFCDSGKLNGLERAGKTINVA